MSKTCQSFVLCQLQWVHSGKSFTPKKREISLCYQSSTQITPLKKKHLTRIECSFQVPLVIVVVVVVVLGGGGGFRLKNFLLHLSVLAIK